MKPVENPTEEQLKRREQRKLNMRKYRLENPGKYNEENRPIPKVEVVPKTSKNRRNASHLCKEKLKADPKRKSHYAEVQSNYEHNKYAERKSSAIEKLGGKCVRCGSTDNLEFDHIDETTKFANMSDIFRMRQELIDAKLDKCQLLCHNCHMQKTYEERHARRPFSEKDIIIMRTYKAIGYSIGQITEMFADSGKSYDYIKKSCNSESDMYVDVDYKVYDKKRLMGELYNGKEK
jgi:hypothetical protein